MAKQPPPTSAPVRTSSVKLKNATNVITEFEEKLITLECYRKKLIKLKRSTVDVDAEIAEINKRLEELKA